MQEVSLLRSDPICVLYFFETLLAFPVPKRQRKFSEYWEQKTQQKHIEDIPI